MNETIIRQLAEQYKDEIIALRRQFHRCPELGREEYKTAEVIRAELDKLGIPWRAVGATGTVATLEGTEKGHTVVLRSDIDALPVEEETGLPFASEVPGMMHIESQLKKYVNAFRTDAAQEIEERLAANTPPASASG